MPVWILTRLMLSYDPRAVTMSVQHCAASACLVFCYLLHTIPPDSDLHSFYRRPETQPLLGVCAMTPRYATQQIQTNPYVIRLVGANRHLRHRY